MLCLLLDIRKSRTTPYHPMGNGMCERFNRTLLDMLGTLRNDQKHDWKRSVAPLVHAYNSTRHETTCQAPFFLMFGRCPRLPVDLAFGLNVGGSRQFLSQYVEGLRKRLKSSYEMASRVVEKSQQRQKGSTIVSPRVKCSRREIVC